MSAQIRWTWQNVVIVMDFSYHICKSTVLIGASLLLTCWMFAVLSL